MPGGGPDPLMLTAKHSTSMGNPSEGWLKGGASLPLYGDGYLFNPHRDPQRRFGTVELVQSLVRAAWSVEQAFPGGALMINDISLPGGGDITGHASHRNGRDVDVMFYLVDSDGKPFPAKAIPIEPDGSGVDYRDLKVGDDDVPVKLDVARTWAFVAALMSDQAAHINRIFVVEHVRAMLIAHAKKIGASALVVRRFGEVSCQPRFPHDDHFHIRFFCSLDDIVYGCEDTFPIYPWHSVHLAAEKVPVRLAKRRHKKRPKLTSVAEARRRARRKYGKLHEDVTAFLDRRKSWVAKPHPGRTYCQ